MIPLLIALVPQTPASDPRFATPTAIDVTMEPVAPALAELGKKAGCSLEASTALKDRKIALHTEEEPLGATLDRLAEVLDARWTVAGNGWRLDPIPERMAELAGYRALRKGLAEQAVRDEIEKDLQRTRSEPYSVIRKRRSAWWKAMGDAKTEEETRKAMELPGNDDPDLDAYLVATLYDSLDEEERRRFWSGEVFYASTDATEEGRALPREATSWDSNGSDGDDGAARGELLIFAAYDVDRSSLWTRTDQGGGMGRSEHGGDFGDGKALEEHPFSKRQWWINPPPLFKDRRNEPLKTLAKAGTGPWLNGFWSVADVLARFHARSGLPIVALVTRQPWSYADPDTASSTVGAGMDDLLSRAQLSLRQSGPYLMARPNDWEESLDREPPEAAYRAFEKIERPTLDDYGAIALRLNDRQVSGFDMYPWVSRHPTGPFSQGIAVLWLWGSLTPAMRAAVRRGRPVPYTSMTPAMRTWFEKALLGGIRQGAELGPSVRQAFRGRWNDAVVREFALWGDHEDVQAWEDASFRPQGAPQPTANAIESAFIRITLGVAPRDGFAFSLSDPNR